MTKLANGLQIPLFDGAIPTPPAGKVSIFARDNFTVWVKFSDGTEERLSVG
jgi:hypothetical protein